MLAEAPMSSAESPPSPVALETRRFSLRAWLIKVRHGTVPRVHARNSSRAAARRGTIVARPGAEAGTQMVLVQARKQVWSLGKLRNVHW